LQDYNFRVTREQHKWVPAGGGRPRSRGGASQLPREGAGRGVGRGGGGATAQKGAARRRGPGLYTPRALPNVGGQGQWTERGGRACGAPPPRGGARRSLRGGAAAWGVTEGLASWGAADQMGAARPWRGPSWGRGRGGGPVQGRRGAPQDLQPPAAPPPRRWPHELTPPPPRARARARPPASTTGAPPRGVRAGAAGPRPRAAPGPAAAPEKSARSSPAPGTRPMGARPGGRRGRARGHPKKSPGTADAGATNPAPNADRAPRPIHYLSHPSGADPAHDGGPQRHPTPAGRLAVPAARPGARGLRCDARGQPILQQHAHAGAGAQHAAARHARPDRGQPAHQAQPAGPGVRRQARHGPWRMALAGARAARRRGRLSGAATLARSGSPLPRGATPGARRFRRVPIARPRCCPTARRSSCSATRSRSLSWAPSRPRWGAARRAAAGGL
jgi:hypothetical protein